MLKFNKVTGYLEPGIYEMTLSQLYNHKVLASNEKRKALIISLESACNHYWKHKITEIYIDGSFITEKPFPGDIDGFVIADNNQLIKLLADNSVWSNFKDRIPIDGKLKMRMWVEHRIEFFIHPYMKATPKMYFIEFFTRSRDGIEKGIIKIIK